MCVKTWGVTPLPNCMADGVGMTLILMPRTIPIQLKSIVTRAMDPSLWVNTTSCCLMMIMGLEKKKEQWW